MPLQQIRYGFIFKTILVELTSVKIHFIFLGGVFLELAPQKLKDATPTNFVFQASLLLLIPA